MKRIHSPTWYRKWDLEESGAEMVSNKAVGPDPVLSGETEKTGSDPKTGPENLPK